MKKYVPAAPEKPVYALLLSSALFVSAQFASVISVQAAFNVSQASAANVVFTLIPPSSGLTTSSISSVGDAAQRGTFTAASSDNIGGANSLTSGAILSSGNVTDAVGPNDSPRTANDPYPESFSDSTLEGFTQQASSDVSSVTFTVTNPTVDTARIALRYTFASEEYPEFVQNLFNDGAYIMVDGNVVSSVEVQTANFNDNGGSQVWEYDGFTDVATVVIEIPSGGSKVIKILVGDCRDSDLDSALLVQSEIVFGAVPVVTVYCTDGSSPLAHDMTVTEESFPTPFFIFQRSGVNIGSPLTVDFTLHYTPDINDPSQAIWGQDYDVDDAIAAHLGPNWFSPWRVTFEPNAAELWVPIYVIDDPYAEIEEFIYCHPSPSAKYTFPQPPQPGTEAWIGIAGPGPDTE